MGSSDKSEFVKNNWLKFETVIREIIEDELGVEDGKDGVIIKQTNPSNDGGYDGLFCIPLSESSVGKVYRLLFEAKLRSNDNADLPLDSFSKAVIVAINRDANALIVGTNLHISIETKNRLDDFSKHTGLCIDYIEGMDIDVWIDGHPEKSEIAMFSKVLQNSMPSSEEKSILPLLKSSIEIKQLSEEIIGEKRNNDFKSALSELTKSRRSIIVKGARGTGKSYFVNCLINSLSDSTSCIRIDLSILRTPRTVFSTIVSSIWGIEENLIFSLESEDLYDAISKIGDQELDKRVCDSIVNLLSKRDNEYREKATIFDRHLICFLEELISLAGKRRFFVISVSNSDVASTEMLEFITTLKSSLSNYAPFIVEIRTGFNAFVSNNSWDRYTNNLCIDRLNTNIYTLKNWDKQDAKIFISQNTNGLDDTGIDYILNQTDANPLMIYSYVNYLNSSRLLEKISPALHKAKLREMYIDDVSDIIWSLIKSVCKASGGFNDLSAKCLVLISFSGGKLSRNCVEELLGCKIEEIRSAFSAEVVLFSGEDVSIKHLIYQEVLEKNQHKLMDFFDIHELAENLYMYLINNEIKDDSWYMTIIKVCEYLNKIDDMLAYILIYCQELFRKGQYHLCQNILKKIDFTDVESVVIAYNADLVDAFEMYLQLDFYLKEKDKGETARDIKKIDSLVKKLGKMHELDERKRDQVCNGYLILARYKHSIGCFAEAYNIMKNARAFVDEYSNLPESHTVYEVCTEYAIAVKEKEGLDGYIESLKADYDSYPLAHTILFLLNSAQYQRAYPYYPNKAKKYIEETETISKQLSASDDIHNKVHMANAYLHLKEYEAARLYAEEYRKLATEYGLVNEVGRLENIIGCTYLNPESIDVKRAKERFESGMKIYKKSMYYSYYWPLLYNYVILCEYIGNKDEVLDRIAELCSVLNTYHHLVNKSKGVTKHYMAYMCVLRILKGYLKKPFIKPIVDDCIKKLMMGVSHSEICEYAHNPQKRFPSSKLSKTSFHHGKLYLITY